MSDDGYHGISSPFDEFDEYWGEEEGDIAGDLAEHTSYSPVWQDDIDYRLEYGYSDWEYYSDDYYDEDPILLRQHPQDGTSPVAVPTPGQRGRKRKLAEIEDKAPLSLGERKHLETCVVGTTWAKTTADPVDYYEEGQSDKLALLKDWRKNFQTNKSTPVRRKIHRDESWANDLSLEDMGLRSAGGRETSNPEPVAEHDGMDEDELASVDEVPMMPDGDDEGDRPNSIDHQENTLPAAGIAQRRRGNDTSRPASPQSRPPPSADHLKFFKAPAIAPEVEERPSKKARNGPEVPTHAWEPDVDSGVLESVKEMPKRGKKRPVEEDDEADADGEQEKPPGVNNRAKRVASRKLSAGAAANGESPPPLPTTRSTRSRKKINYAE